MNHFVSQILLLFSLCAKERVSEQNFLISGEVQNYDGDSLVIVRGPIDGHFNNVSYKGSDTIKMSDGKFQVNISCKRPVFIFLEIHGEYINMIATPGGKVSINLDYSTVAPGKGAFCKFGGTNAAGHSLYFEYNYIPVAKYESVWKILKTQDVKNFIEEIKREIKKQISPFDGLFQKKEISEEYYELVSTTIKSLLIFEAVRRLGDMNILNVKIKSSSERINTVRKLFNLHSPLNENVYFGHQSYFYSQFYFTFNRAVHYGTYIYDQPDTVIQIGDKAFVLRNEYAAMSEIRNAQLKEFLFATYLKSALMVNLEEKIKDEISFFFAAFPGSIYAESILKTRNAARERIKHVKANSEKFYRPVLPEIIDSAGKYKDFSFANVSAFKDKLLYIDIWATWCGPCLQEMQFNYQVDSLLHVIGAKRVYISIDNSSQKDKWQNIIDLMHLGGYHILAGNEFSKVISRTVGYSEGLIAIPHYMIIRNGEILLKDAARPSDFEKFKRQLVELNELPFK